MSVKLSDMIEAMESQTDEDCTFINKETGEVVVIPEEFMRKAEEDTGEPVDELAKDVIDNEDKYLAPRTNLRFMNTR